MKIENIKKLRIDMQIYINNLDYAIKTQNQDEILSSIVMIRSLVQQMAEQVK